MPLAEREKLEREVDRGLKSRCVGLLELRTRIVKSTAQEDGTVLKEETYKDVVYLHRTVAEYLRTPDIWEKILGWTAGVNFNAYGLLLQCIVMEMKTTEIFRLGDDYKHGRRTLLLMVEDAMILAQDAEYTGKVSVSALLRELDIVAALHFIRIPEYQTSPEYSWHSHFMGYLSGIYRLPQSPTPTHDDFLSIMVYYGLHYSVADVLSTHPQAVLTKKGKPLLHYACTQNKDQFNCSMYPGMVRLLIESGADLNQVFENRTAWQYALESLKVLCSGPPIDMVTESKRNLSKHPLDWVSALILLVKHGADPNAYIDNRSSRQSARVMRRQYNRGSRQSALRVVRRQFDSFLQGRMDGKGRTLVITQLKSRGLRMPYYTDDVESLICFITPENKADLRLLRDAVVDLINLLKSKGAKEREWSEENGKWVKIRLSEKRSLGSFIRRLQKTIAKKENAKAEDPGSLWSLI
jgi:hypothetical protein